MIYVCAIARVSIKVNLIPECVRSQIFQRQQQGSKSAFDDVRVAQVKFLEFTLRDIQTSPKKCAFWLPPSPSQLYSCFADRGTGSQEKPAHEIP